MFNRLAERLVDSCKKHGFDALGRPADRHGSWELRFHKESNGLSRFVVVGLTPSPPLVDQKPTIYMVEVWAGAESRERFSHRLVSGFRALDSSLEEETSPQMFKAVESALGVAGTLKESDLAEAHPRYSFFGQN